MDIEKIKRDDLRKKAEITVQNQFGNEKNQHENVEDLLHELRVHQIELEMQNEELQEAQIKLEDSQRKYFDLYNFAPDGYFTLDENGIVLESNLKGASLLGVERQNLHKTAFIQYITPAYRNRFHHHIQRVMETGTNHTIDLKLFKMDNNALYAHLETITVQVMEMLKSSE